MEMQLLYVFNLFSLVGVIGLLVYVVMERAKQQAKDEKYDRQSDKLDRLERHVYELEERLAKRTPLLASDEINDQIIAMYQEGKDLMFIEKSLDVSRAKIEMVLKFHKLNAKREKT